MIEDDDLTNLADNVNALVSKFLADMRDGISRDHGDTEAWQMQPLADTCLNTTAQAQERLEKALKRLRG